MIGRGQTCSFPSLLTYGTIIDMVAIMKDIIILTLLPCFIQYTQDFAATILLGLV